MSPENVCLVLISGPNQIRRATCSTLFPEDYRAPPLDTNTNSFLMGRKNKGSGHLTAKERVNWIEKEKDGGRVERRCSPGRDGPVFPKASGWFTQKSKEFPYVLPLLPLSGLITFLLPHPIPPPPPLSCTPDTELPGPPKGQRQKGLTSLPSILACASWCLCFLRIPVLKLNCVVQDSEFTKMAVPLPFQSGLKDSGTSWGKKVSE